MINEKPSKVLLVCIYDTGELDISNENIYDRFALSGTVRRILIFQKGHLTKCFVEMANEEQAAMTINLLDGKKLFQASCKMHIYFSPLLELDLKNKFTKGKDFTSTEASLTSDRPLQFSLEDLQASPVNPLSELKKSKTTDPNTLCKAVLELQDDLSQRIKTQIQQLVDDDSFWGYRQPVIPVPVPMWLPLQYHQPPQYPPIITFKYSAHLTTTEAYNLFSNFGNIQRVIKKPQQVFIVYTDLQFATSAKHHLSGLTLFDHPLQISFASACDIAQKPRQFMQSVTYDTSYDRFNLSKVLSINAPSEVLHVSNLKKESCTEARLRKLFAPYGDCQKIQLLLNIKDKFMALVRMPSLRESLNATAALHNREIAGRRVHISFTKSKI